MLLRLATALAALTVLCVACHAERREAPCDPYRTPRVYGVWVPAGQERSAHAPYLTGDCLVCHTPGAPSPGETAEQAREHMGLIKPVNEHCASCHRELFDRPPKGHPPAEAACAGCHDPHSSKNRKLLRDDDTSRACLDYPPPFPSKRPAAKSVARPSK